MRKATHALRLAGDPILSRVCREIAHGERLPPSLLTSMRKTLEATRGVAIAAPQLGEPLRLFMLAAERPATEPCVVVNPRILRQSRTHDCGWESCLSVPDYAAVVRRPRSIVASYETAEGEHIERVLNGCVHRTPLLDPNRCLTLVRLYACKVGGASVPARARPPKRSHVHGASSHALTCTPERPRVGGGQGAAAARGRGDGRGGRRRCRDASLKVAHAGVGCSTWSSS